MAQSIILNGAQIKLYIGENLINECQNVSYSIDYGEVPIYGIDSSFPQEIISTRVSVKGSASLIYSSVSGGLQGMQLIPRITQVLYAPYQSFRLQDRKTKKNLFACPSIKISNVQTNIVAKGTVKVSFSFVGIVPYEFMDLN